MKKRWLLRLGLFAGVAVLGFWFVLWLTAPEHRINQRCAAEIQSGMTLNEVVAIIRVPPGDHTTMPIEARSPRLKGETLHFRKNRQFNNPESPRLKAWLGDTGIMLIIFDADEKVGNVFYDSIEETWQHMLRRWFHIR